MEGFQYKYTEPWEDSTATMTGAAMKLRFVPTSEGYFDAMKKQYYYNFLDHLGNIRLSYADADGNGVVTGDIVVNNCRDTPDGQVCNNYIIPGEAEGANDYYPFGLLHNNQYNNFENAYQYKYQGQELQETGWYSFKWRNYMPDVGRFFNVDPLAMLAPDKTPYHFVSNNPINRIDPLGLTDYKVNGETRTIDDGHNDVNIKVSERQFNRLQRKFDRGGSGYERMMNRMSVQNGFTTFGTFGEAYTDASGTHHLQGISITSHKAGGDSYAEYSMKNPVVDAIDKTNNYYGGWEGSFATNAYKRAVIATALSAQLDGNTRVVNQMSGLSKSFKYSNAIGKAGPWVSGVVGIYNTAQGFQQDGGTIGYHTQRAALGSSLSIVGGSYGATYGASIGASIGVWFVGVGAVPGAIIGGLIGGIGGGMLGQTAGEAIIDEVHK